MSDNEIQQLKIYRGGGIQDEFEEEIGESNKHTGQRGRTPITHSGNFTFVFGCQPEYGIKAESKLIMDTIELYIKNFDPEKGEIVVPDAYAKVISSDAKFEIVTCVEAQKLLL